MLSAKIAMFVSAVACAGVVAGGAALAGQVPVSVSGVVPPSSTSEITIYEKPNFQGRSLTFVNRMPSLAAVGFNDLTASVKIKGTRDWVLCEHRNFFGRCVRVHLKEKDLKRQKFLGVTSSVYPVPVPPPVPPKPR